MERVVRDCGSDKCLLGNCEFGGLGWDPEHYFFPELQVTFMERKVWKVLLYNTISFPRSHFSGNLVLVGTRMCHK